MEEIKNSFKEHLKKRTIVEIQQEKSLWKKLLIKLKIFTKRI